MPLTRTDFQQLADARAAEAEALIMARLWDGAYYLAGYAVECALKACVAKLTQAEEFPDKERAFKAFSHKVEDLLELAKLKKERDDAIAADPTRTCKRYWDAVREWNEAARYARWNEAQARDLWVAITDPTHGVLPWVKSRWRASASSTAGKKSSARRSAAVSSSRGRAGQKPRTTAGRTCTSSARTC
ncbi:MAG: hypothetical protein U0804_05815 [Gemmataceae bacterium]